MKIAIVGAGIVGVTTAYELASDGHEVTVFEQRSAAAEEASFATAGLLAQARAARRQRRSQDSSDSVSALPRRKGA